MKSPFKLIINGDDFGISNETNEAIIHAFKLGTLTSCSLMVTGSSFDSAVRLAHENKGLAVGIHLVTVMGKSVLPHSEIPTLVDLEQNFSNNPTKAGLRYYFSGQARVELKKEIRAQFEKFVSTGLKMTHIDSHLHMHVHPVIFQTAQEIGEDFGVRCMRVPDDELGTALRFDSDNAVRKAIYSLIFALLSQRMKKRLRARGFTFAERVYGNILSGHMNEEYVLYVIGHLSNRISEIYFHPAMHKNGGSLAVGERQCLKELEILSSPKLTSRIKELGVSLASYADLEA